MIRLWVIYNMKNKYNKNWGSIDRFNLIIYLIFMLDPQYKMITMKFQLKKCKGDDLVDMIDITVKLL